MGISLCFTLFSASVAQPAIQLSNLLSSGVLQILLFGLYPVYSTYVVKSVVITLLISIEPYEICIPAAQVYT